MLRYLRRVPSWTKCAGRSLMRLYPSASFSTSSRSSLMTSSGRSAMRLWLRSTVSSLGPLPERYGATGPARAVLRSSAGRAGVDEEEEGGSRSADPLEPAERMRWCPAAASRGVVDRERGPCDCESDMGEAAERRERTSRRRAWAEMGASAAAGDRVELVEADKPVEGGVGLRALLEADAGWASDEDEANAEAAVWRGSYENELLYGRYEPCESDDVDDCCCRCRWYGRAERDDASLGGGGGFIMPSRRAHSRVDDDDDDEGPDDPRLVPVDVDGRRGTESGAVGGKNGLFIGGGPAPPPDE